ncbi:uncharacterized protein LOC142821298 [Pelodiscus sinensis]|uniref:uncharacterized protein LOC142821298 n=1 Tax=Pelodiscus sinensis TaxID=13735 RepID=UPI003F6B8B2E
MDTKRNFIGLSFKSNAEKRDTSLQRSGVQSPARGTSQLSRVVASQPSQVVASQPFRGMSQPSPVTSQEPSRVTTSKQRSERTSQPTRVTVPEATRVTVPEATRVTVPEACHGTSQVSRVVVSQPSRGISPLSHVSASLAPPPAPPAPTPTPPAQPCGRRPSNSWRRGHRRSQQRCSPVSEGISSPWKDEFRRPRATLDAELAGEAEGSGGTTTPLPPIQPPAAAAAIPEQPKEEVPMNLAPPPRERKVRWAPQAGTGPLPDSRLFSSGVPTPAQGTPQQPSQVVTSQPSQPPAPPPTPTPPAQPCCRRRLQQCFFLLPEGYLSLERERIRQPQAKLAAESAGGAEGSRSSAMPLPSIQPPSAAAAGPTTTRAQPKQQVGPEGSEPPPRERKPRRAPQAGTGPLPNSHLCTSRQQQLQPQPPQPPQQPRKSCPTRSRGRAVRNPGMVARPEPEAAVPTTKYEIKLSDDATSLLLRRHLQNKCGCTNPVVGTRLLPGSQSRAGLDLTSCIKISLLNDQDRYDDEDYDEDPAPGVVDQELVRRCTEWLDGMKKEKRGDRLGKLRHPENS